MKKIVIFTLVAYVAYVVALVAFCGYIVSNKKTVLPDFTTQRAISEFVSISKEEVVIQYGNFKGRPLQLVYKPTKARIILRVKVKGNEQLLCAGNEHDFLLKTLRDEVWRLTSGQPITMGKTGYTFIYEGGYPIWGPHEEIGVNEYQSLLFAQNAKVVGKEIRARGTPTVERYDGYRLWEPRPYRESVVISRKGL